MTQKERDPHEPRYLNFQVIGALLRVTQDANDVVNHMLNHEECAHSIRQLIVSLDDVQMKFPGGSVDDDDIDMIADDIENTQWTRAEVEQLKNGSAVLKFWENE